MKSDIKYSNCWEDAYRLQDALQVNRQSRILSIASGGDNSLYLLSKHPTSLHCIDSNEEQLFVTQLKACAIQYLDYPEFLAFLGFAACNHRIAYFDQIKKYLPANAREYFNQHNFLIHKGIIHQGKFERYFQLFAKWVLPLIHGLHRKEKLFEPKAAQEQKLFYKSEWNNCQWRLLFRFFFSQILMERLGRDQEKFKHVKQDIGQEAFKRTALHLQSVDVFDNYLLNYCVYGFFKHRLPPYALQEHFIKIKTWLQHYTINYEIISFQDYIKQPSRANCLNLSNIFEYQSEEEFIALQSIMNRNIKSNACLSYWELFNVRGLSNANFTLQEINKRDLGFFYARNKSYLKK